MTLPRKRRRHGKPPSAGTTSTQSGGLPKFARSKQRRSGSIPQTTANLTTRSVSQSATPPAKRLARLMTAMIVARVIEPAAKLATARRLSDATASHALGALLGLGEVDADELY